MKNKQTPNHNFKKIRKEFKWSQIALAKKMGISQSAISLIEKGERKLSSEELGLFADILHIDPNRLFE